MKAKEVFPQKFLDTLPDPKVRKLIEKISVLGAANLPPKEREEVCLYSIFYNWDRLKQTVFVHDLFAVEIFHVIVSVSVEITWIAVES